MIPEGYFPTWGPEPVLAPAAPQYVPEVAYQVVRLDPRDLLLIFGVVMAANLLTIVLVGSILGLRRS